MASLNKDPKGLKALQMSTCVVDQQLGIWCYPEFLEPKILRDTSKFKSHLRFLSGMDVCSKEKTINLDSVA